MEYKTVIGYELLEYNCWLNRMEPSLKSILTSYSRDSFRKCTNAFAGIAVTNINREADVNFQGIRLSLNDIRTKTDLYAQEAWNQWNGLKELVLIEGIDIRLI